MTDTPLLPNIAEFSVSELTSLIKRQLEGEFPRVRVRGEISGCKYYPSGHCYFNLKDGSAVLNGVAWQSNLAKMVCKPEDGTEVILTGRVSIGTRSQYQIVVEQIELAGIGAILKMIEDRKRKLEEEGLFLPERKKQIPFLPRTIGVVTSPAGAVIRDILHRLRDRCPSHVIVWPVAVQGQGAAEQIAAAIRGFNNIRKDGLTPRPDLLIVARGGGSIEDLMPFNEEIVVRAAAESTIPLISAVGHETDWTLIDHAADLRAPTPTGAAEMAVPVKEDLLDLLRRDEDRLFQWIRGFLGRYRNIVEREARAISDPARLLENGIQNLDQWVDRWRNSYHRYFDRPLHSLTKNASLLRHPMEQIRIAESKLHQSIEAFRHSWRLIGQQKQHQLERWTHLLQSYSYQHVLERGFALVRDQQGHPIDKAAKVKVGQSLHLQFQDEEIEVVAGSRQGKLL